MTLALSVPHLSLLQILAGIVLLAWIAMVLVIGFGSRVHGVEPAAPSEPDELDGLFEDRPVREDTR
jgi:hypothetical protein